MNYWYRISIACAIVPMFAGLSIFTAWVLSRAIWLEVAGFFNICAGIILFIIGVSCCLVYCSKARDEKVTGYQKKAAISLLLLLVNFPLALSLIVTYDSMVSTCTLIVDNQTTAEITGFKLIEARHTHNLEDIPPRSKVEININFKNEGAVDYSFKVGGKPQRGVAFGYITSGYGVTAEMVLSGLDSVSIKERI